jgi:hypothetical protein
LSDSQAHRPAQPQSKIHCSVTGVSLGATQTIPIASSGQRAGALLWSGGIKLGLELLIGTVTESKQVFQTLLFCKRLIVAFSFSKY